LHVVYIVHVVNVVRECARKVGVIVKVTDRRKTYTPRPPLLNADLTP